MTTGALLPLGVVQFLDSNGQPLVGGQVAFYIPSTLTLKNTYQDVGETILNTNPVILDGAGRATIFGDGAYDMSVADANGDLQWTGYTEASLSQASVSSFMLPLLGSTSSAQFIEDSGIGSYVAAAVSAVSLMPGPQGPQGTQGVQGIQGPQGPAGTYPAPTYLNADPGYFRDTVSGYTRQWGTTTTNSSGTLIVNFPIPFIDTVPAVVCTVYYQNQIIHVQTVSATSFSVAIQTISGAVGVTSFGWSADGF